MTYSGVKGENARREAVEYEFTMAVALFAEGRAA
jgi:hypothetical protein